MPKPVYAQLDDVTKLRAELLPQIEATRDEIEPTVKATEKRLQNAIAGLADQVTANADAAAKATKDASASLTGLTETRTKELRAEIAQMVPPLEGAIAKSREDLEARIAKVAKHAQTELHDVIGEMAKNMDEQLQALTQSLTDGLREAKEKAEADLAKQREELNAAIKEAKKEAKTQARLLKEGMDKAFEETKEEQAIRDNDQDLKTQGMVNDCRMTLDVHDETLKANKELAEENLRNASNTLRDQTEQLRKDAEKKLEEILGETEKLRNAVSEVENLSTKRVDWVITNASRRIRPTSPSKSCLHRSYFSPKFNMAGAHGLQLEIQLFRQGDIAVADEDAGDVAVFLWACKGMNLVYRLYVGSKYQTVEKVFNGRIPYGTKRFCFLRDQINRADDTLKVSVEILEAHRAIETIIEQPPEPLEPPPPGIEIEKPLDGMVLFHRHTNNRLMDQVKNQVDLMRSRMVRKVEWRVEQASRLRSCFGMGECICSAQFNAAGLEGLQLLFYPSGYKGANDGFCSLFVYGPAGCTVKCVLIVGNQRREANHSFEEPGAFGRVNFCRFDAIHDQSDNTVLVGLEIEAAHQDSVAKVSHPTVVAGDKRSQAEIDGTQANAVQSVVKLQGTPGKQHEGLDETRVLPSLWTASFPDGEQATGDGMHTFDELKAPTRGRGGRRGLQAPQAPLSPPTTGRRPGAMRSSDSMPTLSPDAASGGGDGTPLPRLARTTSGFERGGGSMPASRRPRRSGLASTTTSSLGVTAC
eukprot:TRINITY_DN5470_c0_g6_i1.p1 TRINITY_DN5470_c0_g6~~TRINITY_DN5470_c0_g6_i1.p1  ORF type:complete len:756 (+),score=222.14 TRINITY_DN5470_c0_g6_i1:179-2446(+)